MTAKTTVTIEAVHPDGTDLTNQRVVVQLIHGGAGGTVDGELIAERTTVPLTGAGPWSIALYPTAAISPSGCFYRFTIDNSSPTINRDISVPSSGPVSWTDAAILLENPDPPVTVPAAISGDPLDVLRVNAEGTGYELAPGLATALGVAPEPLLLHHSFRRAEDGEAAGMSNGQGLLGPKALTDISDFLPLVYQEAQVDAGALRLRAVSPHTLSLAFSNAILGTAPVGRGGFMIDEYGAATVAADCDGVVFTAAAVADGSGDGYAALLRLTGDGIGGIDAEVVIVAVASGVFGADLDAFTLPRMPVPGDTVEIRVDGTDSPATISGFWNGEEVVSVTDATTDPSTFTTASVSATTDSLADPTKWLPAVTDAWFTDGGAWWPGSLPGAGGGGTVDVVSNVATNTILGRSTAGSGNSEELAPSAVRALLDLEVGTDVQAYDADLAAVAALSTDAFGRDLLTKTDAAAVRSYIGAVPTDDMPRAASWSGAICAPLGPQLAAAGTEPAPGYEYWHALWVPAGTYTAIQVHSTVAAASTWRLGIYDHHPDFYPTTVLLDAGTVNMNSTAGVQALTISYTVTTARWLWMAAKTTAYTAIPTVTSMHGDVHGGGAQILGWPGRTSTFGYSGLSASGRGTGALATAPTFTVSNLKNYIPKITLVRS